MDNNNNSQSQEPNVRWSLALIITILSIIGISLIATVTIFSSTDRAAASQTVMSAVLPLFAAWVSTVLAYYYSKENLQAATQSVKELMSPEEKLKTILVKDKMIKFSDMIYFTYSDDLKVQDMLDKLKSTGKGNRFPFLGDKKQPDFILHKSAIDEALVECSLKGDNLSQMTLKDLFGKVAGLKELGQGTFGVVAESVTLADAKTEMQRIKDAQDIFITNNGRKDGAVLGWITNVIIEQSSRV